MREVKSISERNVIKDQGRRNLRKGGTDRREHKLKIFYQKDQERGKKMIGISR